MIGPFQKSVGKVGRSEAAVLCHDPRDSPYSVDTRGSIRDVTGTRYVVPREWWPVHCSRESEATIEAVLNDIGVSTLILCNARFWAPENRVSMYTAKSFAHSTDGIGNLRVLFNGVISRDSEVTGWRCFSGSPLEMMSYALSTSEGASELVSGFAFLLSPTACADEADLRHVVESLVSSTRARGRQTTVVALVAAEAHTVGMTLLHVYLQDRHHLEEAVVIDVIAPKELGGSARLAGGS